MAGARGLESATGEQAAYSVNRLTEIAAQLEPLDALVEETSLCIYATGSYGRLEAWSGSDIDLFFLHAPDDGARFPYLTFIRVAARLIEVTDAMSFPPFSGDGRYLEVLDVADMERILGSPEDDSTNAFTARMLLLLESRPIYGHERYEDYIRRVVGFYFRDAPDHATTFVPTFLTNDILRFWRTLTLNYEHDRFRIRAFPTDNAQAQNVARAKVSLKNYKLKVSRLATCFSMVLHLAVQEPPVTHERVVELCSMTPSMRLDALAFEHRKANDAVAELHHCYDRFLACVQRPADELLSEFGDADFRRERLAEATRFGDLIYDLLRDLVPRDRLRPLIL